MVQGVTSHLATHGAFEPRGKHQVPARGVAKPRRLPNTRRALTPWELEQTNAVARISGNDIILDALLPQLHTETTCRGSGALAIHLEDLDPTYCLLQLREKGSTAQWQPVRLMSRA
jgi:hypothetical protein